MVKVPVGQEDLIQHGTSFFDLGENGVGICGRIYDGGMSVCFYILNLYYNTELEFCLQIYKKTMVDIPMFLNRLMQKKPNLHLFYPPIRLAGETLRYILRWRIQNRTAPDSGN